MFTHIPARVAEVTHAQTPDLKSGETAAPSTHGPALRLPVKVEYPKGLEARKRDLG
jgi:hypothetical protein